MNLERVKAEAVARTKGKDKKKKAAATGLRQRVISPSDMEKMAFPRQQMPPVPVIMQRKNVTIKQREAVQVEREV